MKRLFNRGINHAGATGRRLVALGQQAPADSPCHAAAASGGSAGRVVHGNALWVVSDMVARPVLALCRSRRGLWGMQRAVGCISQLQPPQTSSRQKGVPTMFTSSSTPISGSVASAWASASPGAFGWRVQQCHCWCRPWPWAVRCRYRPLRSPKATGLAGAGVQCLTPPRSSVTSLRFAKRWWLKVSLEECRAMPTAERKGVNPRPGRVPGSRYGSATRALLRAIRLLGPST